MIIWTTYTPDFQPLADLVLPFWQEYADRHGYKLVAQEAHPIFPQHHSFGKTRLVEAVVSGVDPSEGVFVIDLDMLPTNMAYDLHSTECETPKYPSCGVAMGKDINGWNSGAYFIDRNDWAQAWLECIVEMRGVCTSEQHAMWLINGAFGVAEAKGINSIPYHEYPGFDHQTKDHYSQWEPGDFICHLPGMTLADRLRILQEYIPRIQR